MSRIDCVVIGYNETRIEALIDRNEPFREVSGGYRHMLVNLRDVPRTAALVLRSVESGDKVAYFRARHLWGSNNNDSFPRLAVGEGSRWVFRYFP